MTVLKGFGTIEELYKRLTKIAEEINCDKKLFGPDYECLNNEYEEKCLFDLINEAKAWKAWENMEECLKNNWNTPYGWFEVI